MRDFTVPSLIAAAKDSPQALIVYSTTWDPLHVLDNPFVAKVLTRFYDYRPQATRGQIVHIMHMRLAFRWAMNGQWVEVFESEAGRQGSIAVD